MLVFKHFRRSHRGLLPCVRHSAQDCPGCRAPLLSDQCPRNVWELQLLSLEWLSVGSLEIHDQKHRSDSYNTFQEGPKDGFGLL